MERDIEEIETCAISIATTMEKEISHTLNLDRDQL